MDNGGTWAAADTMVAAVQMETVGYLSGRFVGAFRCYRMVEVSRLVEPKLALVNLLDCPEDFDYFVVDCTIAERKYSRKK